MVTGGFNALGVLDRVDIYNPLRDTWIFAGALEQPRGRHTATLLTDGSVLIVGGIDDSPNALVGFAQLSGVPRSEVELLFPEGAPAEPRTPVEKTG